MKFKFGVVFFILALFCFKSCSEDCYTDCETIQPKLFIKIISKVDSTDLVFGENKKYDFNDINVFSLEINDSLIYNVIPTDSIGYFDSFFYSLPPVEEGVVVDSFLIINGSYFDIDRIFVDFGNSDVDTLNLSFLTGEEDKCCGTPRQIKTVSHNGVPIFDLDDGDFFTTLLK